MRQPVKRLIDVLVAAVGATVAMPVMAAVAVIVRVSLGSPVFFRQMRIGKDAQPFEIVKFRTMRAGDGDDVERATRVGSMLRASSLDELPQLWNVLRGDMSLVGPRPLLPEYVELYSDRQARRHDVRPGVTGLAQVSGRNELSWPERLETDVRYVEEQSLPLDLKILLRTLMKVIGRDGVTNDGAPMEKFRGET